MRITDNWSKIPIKICDSSFSELEKQLHVTLKKQ